MEKNKAKARTQEWKKRYMVEGKKVYNTASCHARDERKAGNSTRQADAAIQAFFRGDVVKVKDHANSSVKDKILFYRIILRLKVEHLLDVESKGGQIATFEDKGEYLLWRKA